MIRPNVALALVEKLRSCESANLYFKAPATWPRKEFGDREPLNQKAHFKKRENLYGNFFETLSRQNIKY